MPPSTACLCLPRKGFPIHTPLFCYFSFILLFKYAFQSFCHQATLAIACPRFARLLLQLPIRGTPHIVACGAATAPALRGINYHAPRNPRFFYASVSIYYPLYKINCHLQPSSHQIWRALTTTPHGTPAFLRISIYPKLYTPSINNAIPKPFIHQTPPGVCPC